MFSRDGRRHSGIRHKSIALVAYLVVEARPISRDSLCALLWPESGQSAARGNLRNALHGAARVLPDGAIQAYSDTLEIDSSRLWIDVVAFRAGLERLAKSEPTRATLVGIAETLRGDFLEGFSLRDCSDFDLWQLATNERIRLQLSPVLAELVRKQIAEGFVPEAIESVTRLLALDPLEESSHRLAMEAYAHRGRWAAAIEQYEACRTILASELDTEPEAETTRLVEEIRRRNPRFYGIERSVQRSRKFRAAPVPIDRFFGRIAERNRITEYFEKGSRFVSIVGGPGVGKTRLAVETSSQLAVVFVDGMAYVDCTSINDPESVPRLLANALGILDRAVDPIELIDTIATHLSDRRVLIVIDNFEHVIAARVYLSRLLGGTRFLSVLITTREALNLSGEHVVHLLPFTSDPDSAIAMFKDRVAERVGLLLGSDSENEQIHRICSQLDWLPLAIELAVPLLRVYTLPELSPLLSRRLRLLESGYRDVPQRHQTLERAIAWSFDLLSSAEQRLLIELTVTANGFTVDAAKKIAGTHPDATERAMRTLVDKNLVFRDDSEPEHGFTILESTREYCDRLPGSAPLRSAASERHARYYRERAIDMAPRLFGHDQIRWFRLIDAAHANILKALDHSIPTPDPLDVVDVLTWYWYRSGLYRLGYERVRAALDRAPQGSSIGRGRALHDLGWFTFIGGDWRRAHLEYARSLHMCREMDDRAGESLVLSDLGIVTRWLGDTATGTEYGQQAIALARTLDSPKIIVRALICAYATTGGVFAQYQPFAELQEAVEISRRITDPWSLAHAHNGLGDLYFATGNYAMARRHYDDALDGFERIGDRYLSAWTYEGLGRVEAAMGDPTAARIATYHALSLFDSLADELNVGLMLARLVHLGIGSSVDRTILTRATLDILESPRNADLADTPQVRDALNALSAAERAPVGPEVTVISLASAVSLVRSIIVGGIIPDSTTPRSDHRSPPSPGRARQTP